jgi:hypothetical protein
VLMVFTDASTQRQVWDGETLSQTLALETSAPLAYAALDPDRKFTMETNTINNSLTVQPELGPLLRLGSRWLFWMQAVMDFGL